MSKINKERFVESANRGAQLFPYPGSKLKHLKLLYQYAPKLNTYKHMMIPFCGAMPFEMNHPLAEEMATKEQRIYNELIDYGMFLNHPQVNPDLPTSKRLIVTVNDLDKAIIDIGYVLLFETEKFVSTVNSHIKSQAFFYDLLKYEPKNSYERALQKMYKVFCSFGAKQTNWAYTINNIRDRSITYDEKRLADVISRLHHVFMFSEDYEHYLNRFIEKSQHKLFIYADPPYVVTKENDYYTINWEDWDDHQRLFDNLQKASEYGHLFELSYDNDPQIVELYESGGFNVYPVDLRYTMKNQNKRTKQLNELIITNYSKDKFAGDQYIKYNQRKTGNKKQKALF